MSAPAYDGEQLVIRLTPQVSDVAVGGLADPQSDHAEQRDVTATAEPDAVYRTSGA